MSYYEKNTWWDQDKGHPKTGKILFAGLGILLALILLISVIGFFAGWFNAGKNVVSPGNVTKQYQAVITEWEALKASAFNACTAQDAARDDDSPQLVEDPSFAYAATYRKIVVQYNARQKNVFEAGLVGPSGYPKEAPQLDKGPTTDWCDVSGTLSSIK